MPVLPGHEQVNRRAQILRLAENQIYDGKDNAGDENGERCWVEADCNGDGCEKNTLGDDAQEDVAAPTVDGKCVFSEARCARAEGSILDFETLAVKVFQAQATSKTRLFGSLKRSVNL